MRKLLILLSTGTLVAACSNSNDEQRFIGTWRNQGMPNLTITITKHDGGNGFTILEEVYYKATPAKPAIDLPASPASTDRRTYAGQADGKAINVNLGIGFVTPIEIKDATLYFDTGRTCDKCNQYKRVK